MDPKLVENSLKGVVVDIVAIGAVAFLMWKGILDKVAGCSLLTLIVGSHVTLGAGAKVLRAFLSAPPSGGGGGSLPPPSSGSSSGGGGGGGSSLPPGGPTAARSALPDPPGVVLLLLELVRAQVARRPATAGLVAVCVALLLTVGCVR